MLQNYAKGEKYRRALVWISLAFLIGIVALLAIGVSISGQSERSVISKKAQRTNPGFNPSKELRERVARKSYARE